MPKAGKDEKMFICRLPVLTHCSPRPHRFIFLYKWYYILIIAFWQIFVLVYTI